MLQVTFDKDVILSPANEYEVLQLLLGECKTRLGSYAGGRLSRRTTSHLKDSAALVIHISTIP